MNLYVLLTLPFISAAIGWVTNYIAIKMLFYPREEVNLVFFKLQGIFPKRQAVLAQRIGKMVSNELFSIEEIMGEIDNSQNRQEIRDNIRREVEKYIREKASEMNPIIGSFMTEKRIVKIRDKICDEVDKFLPGLIDKLHAKVHEIDVEDIVYQKVLLFSSDKLEALLMNIIQKELKFIEFAGAVLGFVIGLIQVSLVYFLDT